MTQSNPDLKPWKARMKRQTWHLFYWTFAWLCSTSLVSFGSKYWWDYNTLYSGGALLLNLVVGFGMIIANRRHLLVQDDLMKKIQLEAMAIALGVGLVIGLSYEQMASVKLIRLQPEISDLVMIMAVVYMVAVVNSHRKYR